MLGGVLLQLLDRQRLGRLLGLRAIADPLDQELGAAGRLSIVVETQDLVQGVGIVARVLLLLLLLLVLALVQAEGHRATAVGVPELEEGVGAVLVEGALGLPGILGRIGIAAPRHE